MVPDDELILDLIHVIYPEEVCVVANVVLGWAHDALVNAAVDDHVKQHGIFDNDAAYDALVATIARPTDINEAMDLLSDLGTHTFARITNRIAINQLRDHPALRALGRACFPKEQHANQAAAEAQLRSIIKRGLEKDIARIRTYKCRACGAWHVGHRREHEV